MSRLSASALGLTLALSLCNAQAATKIKEAKAAPAAATSAGALDVVKVRDNFYVLIGDDGNTAVQFGADGVLVVNTQSPAMAPKILAAIKSITSQPLRYIVNTNMLPVYTGGNVEITKAGHFIGWRGEVPFADILSHENVLERVSGAMGGAPTMDKSGWPVDTYYRGAMDLHFNNEAIQLIHAPAAQTDGDSIVFFRGSDVICTGGFFVPEAYPYFDPTIGGSYQGIIDALNHVIELAIPDVNEEGGTMIVSGHGRITDEYDIVTYRDMLTIIRDRIADMIKRGLTLEQVLKEKPSRDYDGIYGSDSGGWTTQKFLSAVYKDLKEHPAKPMAAAGEK
jgi:cyclase